MTLIDSINECWRQHVYCRAFVPNIADLEWPMIEVPVPPWYGDRSTADRIRLRQALSAEEVVFHNRAAHSMNKDFLVRLSSIIEDHLGHKYCDLRRENEWMKVLYSLRCVFGHSVGGYSPSAQVGQRPGAAGSFRTHEDVLKELVRLCGLSGVDVDVEGEWPLAIDQVLEPLVQGCLEALAQ